MHERGPARLLLTMALGVALTPIFHLGCAHQALKPGTGDISFRLLWANEADLDLHVMDPQGRHTGVAVAGRQLAADNLEAFKSRYEAEQRGEATQPGGILDIDCNASPERMCHRPIENIYWQPNTAERGSYTFWVVLFRTPVGDGEVPFTLEVRRGESVVESHSGMLSQRNEESARMEFVY